MEWRLFARLLGAAPKIRRVGDEIVYSDVATYIFS